MLKLNSISKSVFEAKDVSDNSKVRVNGKELCRKDIIAAGRVVVCDYFGKMANSRPNSSKEYKSRLAAQGLDYDEASRKFNEKKLLFCAAKVAESLGVEAPATYEDFKRDSSMYGRDPQFWRVLGAIEREVISPLFFAVLSDVGAGLMQIETVPLGGTKEITVRSNDVFLFEDGAWGTGKSMTKNQLYARTITLTPKPYTSVARIKFYRDIVNGDAGWYYASIYNGMYSKMYAKEMGLLKATVGDVTSTSYSNKYIPSGLIAPNYTTNNWINITEKVAAANGVSVYDLMAIGTRAALNNVVPVDGTGGAILGLQYGLGQEWFRNGYLANVGGVDLFPVSAAVVPGTQNSTLDTIDTGNNIYIMARGGFKPIYAAVPEGMPITLVATPDAGDANGTADFTIDINVTAAFDFAPVFASKIGVIRSVYPSA